MDGYKLAIDCAECPDCGEPFCLECEEHYAECAHVGPSEYDDWCDDPQEPLYLFPAPRFAPQHEWEPPRVTRRKKNRSNRLKTLGNAIVPQVAYEIIQRIVSNG